MKGLSRAGRPAAITLFFAAIILVPSMVGFVAKFAEFINTFRGDSEGVFAVMPMVNYILASLGFFCLLLWATINGMFRDLEKPKHDMLEHEDALDVGRSDYGMRVDASARPQTADLPPEAAAVTADEVMHSRTQK